MRLRLRRLDLLSSCCTTLLRMQYLGPKVLNSPKRRAYTKPNVHIHAHQAPQGPLYLTREKPFQMMNSEKLFCLTPKMYQGYLLKDEF